MSVRKTMLTTSVLIILLFGWSLKAETYSINPFVIKLEIPAPKDSAGGIITADINNDGKMDYLVTVPGHLAAYENNGNKLWIKEIDIVVGGSSENEGLPGHCGPGVAAGDVDSDGKCEVIFLTRDSFFCILDGKTGTEQTKIKLSHPEGTDYWEVAIIADFRGTGGNGDILLQTTNNRGYRMGKFLAAYSIEQLIKGGKPMWESDVFVSCAHNSARLADINGDGRDEVLGATIFSSDGKLLAQAIPDRYHMDSVFISDVLPNKDGMEVIMLEEGSNQVQVVGVTGPIWRSHFNQQEPQNAAVGRFKESSDEIFIWCRSRYDKHQKPFVFDPAGKKFFDYKMDDVAPAGWTASGVEIIHTIDWTGKRQQLACATERHMTGDVCLFEPLTGKFVAHFKEKADRLYVADVKGDWREEIIVLNGNELHIYSNNEANPRPNRERLWKDRNYRRLKQCYNYYSP